MKWNLIRTCAIVSLFIVICFVLFKYYIKNGEEYDTFNYNSSLFNTTIDSINSGLDFFSILEEGDIVFDVLIGIRIVMEQTSLLYKYLPRRDELKNVLTTLNELIEKSNKLFDKIFDVLMRTEAKDMSDLGHIVSMYSWSHWTLDSLCVNASLRYEQLIDPDKDKDGGPMYNGLNECLIQYKHKCLIDDHCWNMITEPGFQYYELSHQLMYIMLAEKYGCYERMNDHIKKSGQVSLLNLKTIFCSNMFNETTEFAELAMESSWYRDIFIEDVAFCGILGFHQFTSNKEWVRNMISWQDTSGCWALMNEEHNRRKRTDSVVGSNNCSLHMTTLALGALIVNIKNDFIQLFEPSMYNC